MGSPCEQVLAGEAQLYSERAAERFPLHAQELRALGVESYLAIPLCDSTNRVLGHLAAMDETGQPRAWAPEGLHALRADGKALPVEVTISEVPSEGTRLESELFGHEKGAFSGAASRRIGRFELANQGTLFLDEVGELSGSAQAKLLRMLQGQEFERVGGTQSIHTDARLIAATNRNLAEMVQAGSFREDLFFRLEVFPLRIPPLRERPEDIPLLANAFLRTLARKLGKPLSECDPSCLKRLQRYHWPGHVPELQNVIERAANFADGPLVVVPDRPGGPKTIATLAPQQKR